MLLTFGAKIHQDQRKHFYHSIFVLYFIPSAIFCKVLHLHHPLD